MWHWTEDGEQRETEWRKPDDVPPPRDVEPEGLGIGWPIEGLARDLEQVRKYVEEGIAGEADPHVAMRHVRMFTASAQLQAAAQRTAHLSLVSRLKRAENAVEDYASREDARLHNGHCTHPIVALRNTVNALMRAAPEALALVGIPRIRVERADRELFALAAANLPDPSLARKDAPEKVTERAPSEVHNDAAAVDLEIGDPRPFGAPTIPTPPELSEPGEEEGAAEAYAELEVRVAEAIERLESLAFYVQEEAFAPRHTELEVRTIASFLGLSIEDPKGVHHA